MDLPRGCGGNMANVIVTGAAGFIGRHVVHGLAARGHNVLAVDKRMGTCEHENVRNIQSDLTSLDQLGPDHGLMNDPFTLVHLAWDLAREHASYERQSMQVTTLARLLEKYESRGLVRLVGVGSSEEYGGRGGVLEEDMEPVLPLSPYGCAKRMACLMAFSWGLRSKRSVYWLRPFLAYGPWQQGEMLSAYALRCALRGEEAVFTKGCQQRDFVHVQDVAAAIVAAVESQDDQSGIFNVGTGVATEVRAVIHKIAEAFRCQQRFHLGAVSRRLGEPDVQVASTRKACDRLGWTYRTDWENGIHSTCEWAAQNASYYQDVVTKTK